MTKNLKETCTLWGPVCRSECSLGIYSKFSILCLTVNVITKSLNKWWISAYFFLSFTCCGIIFLYLKWPAYTWTTQQRKRPVNLSLCILLACWEQKTQHFHSCVILGFERGINEIRAFWGDFTQRRLIVSCQLFGTTVGGGEILTAVLKIQVIWDVSPCRLVNLPASSGPTAQDEGTTFHRNISHPSPVDRA